MQPGWWAGGKFPNNYLVAVMKKFYFSALFVAITVTFWACANGPKVDDAELFKTRTGVIGVFRQPAFYCSEASPQYMVLGDSTVLVKPSYSEDQDNLFVTELQPGTATLRSYEYSCGEDKHKFVLDTTRKDGASGIVVPATGFCKTVVSFVEGDQLFSQNDDLLIEFFEKHKVAASIHGIPYCEVVTPKGNKVSTGMDSDSLLQVKYEAAITDAAEIKQEEIYPLVTITPESEGITWDRDSTHVLVITFHDRPDIYDTDTLVMSQEVWTVSEKELYNWYKAHKDGVKDWDVRFKQLLGIRVRAKYTHFSALWVKPIDLVRPAYQTDVRLDSMMLKFDESFDDYSSDKEFKISFKHWFEGNRAKAYDKKTGFPWTRLGYTYDWGAEDKKYGLTEFLILKDSHVRVLFTKNVPTFVKWLEERN
jgi:hypothetical protein